MLAMLFPSLASACDGGLYDCLGEYSSSLRRDHIVGRLLPV